MAALDELHHQCERRGWRVALCGWETLTASGQSRLQLATLEVRGLRFAGGREFLACVPCESLADVDGASVELARALARQGLIS